jgi:hypothetical protein
MKVEVCELFAPATSDNTEFDQPNDVDEHSFRTTDQADTNLESLIYDRRVSRQLEFESRINGAKGTSRS